MSLFCLCQNGYATSMHCNSSFDGYWNFTFMNSIDYTFEFRGFSLRGEQIQYTGQGRYDTSSLPYRLIFDLDYGQLSCQNTFLSTYQSRWFCDRKIEFGLAGQTRLSCVSDSQFPHETDDIALYPPMPTGAPSSCGSKAESCQTKCQVKDEYGKVYNASHTIQKIANQQAWHNCRKYSAVPKSCHAESCGLIYLSNADVIYPVITPVPAVTAVPVVYPPLFQPTVMVDCRSYNRDGLTCEQMDMRDRPFICKWAQKWSCVNGCAKWQGFCFF
ncbi:MAG: hypothetical protein HQK54_05635 [Oligoflexales bacterium]|nr:hypothetical protein [Oligoflexales bacterium]